MTRNAQDIIDDMRNIVKPRIAEMLLEANFEGRGKEDKAEFETEFEMTLTLAEKALEQTRWIPVSERLPENSGNYLITYCYEGKIETQEAVYVEDEEETKWYDTTEIEITLAVIAWMPLPKPYKGR